MVIIFCGVDEAFVAQVVKDLSTQEEFQGDE
jgi:hypothetical protein